MKNKSFIDSLPLTVASLGEKTGIRVVFGANCPSTDMETVLNLPVLKEDADLGDRSAFLGSLIHECAHVRHTNPETLKSLNGFSFHLLNAVEDVRIEHLMAQEYPGAVYLRTCAETSVLKDLDFVRKMKNPFMRYAWGIFVRGNLHWNQKSYYLKAEEVLLEEQEKYLPKPLIEESYKLLEKELPKLTSSDDALELSKKLESLFRKAMSQPEGAKNQNSQKSESSGDSSSSDSKEGQNGSDNFSSDTQEQSCSQNSKRGSSAYNKLKKAEKELDNEENPFDTSKNFQKLMEANRDKTFPSSGRVSSEELGNTSGSVIAGKANSDLPGNSQGFLTNRESTELGKEIISKARAIAPGLKRSLRGLTESKSRDAVSIGYSGKKLDSGRLSRLANWDMRIFRKVSETTKRSTAFQILVDRSGSIGTQGIKEEMICASALFEAVSAVPGTNPAISAFPGLNKKFRETVVPHGIKKLDALASELGAVNSAGSTPFLQAITEIDFLLRNRPEDRKVLFVITDGRLYAPEDEIEELKRKLRRHNIETCCIGIGKDTFALERFFGNENFRCIEGSSQLQKAVFELSRQMLTK